jgi:hypothetical protein
MSLPLLRLLCSCSCRSSCSLPLLHVTVRLEAIAAGLWPEQAEPAADSTRVVTCLRGCVSAAAKDSTSGVVAGERVLLVLCGPAWSACEMPVEVWQPSVRRAKQQERCLSAVCWQACL